MKLTLFKTKTTWLRLNSFSADKLNPNAEPNADCRYGYWWFYWLPRLITWPGGRYNPKTYRILWLRFALDVEFWNKHSVNSQRQVQKYENGND